MGGFTLAPGPAVVMSVRRWPRVTSRRKSISGKAAAIFNAASNALAEVRWSRLIEGRPVSWARYEAMVTARPSECGGREWWYASRPVSVPSSCTMRV